jgi:hypothetical protein
MPSPEYDLGYLQAGVNMLESYLLSSELYWTVGDRPPGGGPAYPQLTLGGINLSLARLRSRNLSVQNEAKFKSLESDFDAMRSRWQVAWEEKASHEFHARLFLWRDFLEEYRAQPANHVDRYAYEVSRRVMIQLLSNDAIKVPQVEAELLDGLDALLKSIFIPGPFIWETEIADGFPRSTYWYLYGKIGARS